MAKGDIVVGLDIGTTKICILVAEVISDSGQVNIIGVGVSPSTGIQKGVVTDIARTVHAISDATEKAQRMSGAEIRSAIVGVTGEHISSINSRGVVAITHHERKVTDDDVARVVENSKIIVLPGDREIIHAIPRGFSLDGQNGIRSPVGMSGTRLEVETHIVTGATSFLQNVITCVEKAGLAVEDIILEPIATADAVLHDDEREVGVALVDIGGGTSDLAVFRSGDISYSAVVPIGGRYVTRDIAAGLRVTLEEAERIKIAHGCAKARLAHPDDMFKYTELGTEEIKTESARTLAEIIEPRVAEGFMMLRQELARADRAVMLPGGIVLSGGGGMLRGVRELATEITGLPARVGSPSGVGGMADTVSAPPYATAVGLVIRGGFARAGSPRRESSDGLLAALTDWFRKVVLRR
jgi:cell division protein FtsA